MDNEKNNKKNRLENFKKGHKLALFLRKCKTSPDVVECGKKLDSKKQRPADKFIKRIADIESKPAVKIGIVATLSGASAATGIMGFTIGYGVINTFKEFKKERKANRIKKIKNAQKIQEFLSKGLTTKANKLKKETKKGNLRPWLKLATRCVLYGASATAGLSGAPAIGVGVSAAYGASVLLKKTGALKWLKNKKEKQQQEPKNRKEKIERRKKIATEVAITAGAIAAAFLGNYAGKEIAEELVREPVIPTKMEPIKDVKLDIKDPKDLIKDVKLEPVLVKEAPIEPLEPIKAKIDTQPIKPPELKPVKLQEITPEPKPEPVLEVVDGAKGYISVVSDVENQGDGVLSTSFSVKAEGGDLYFDQQLDDIRSGYIDYSDLSDYFDNVSAEKIKGGEIGTFSNEVIKGQFEAVEAQKGGFKDTYYNLDIDTNKLNDENLFETMKAIDGLCGKETLNSFIEHFENPKELKEFYSQASSKGVENTKSFIELGDDPQKAELSTKKGTSVVFSDEELTNSYISNADKKPTAKDFLLAQKLANRNSHS